MKFLYLFLLILLTSSSIAQHYHLEDIKVHSHQHEADHKFFKKVDSDSLVRKENISQESLQRKKATNLSQAVDNEQGIDTQTTCGNCGAKRISINGLRGEHTTVLVDGIPMHSAVSSFYGMDAVPVVGIQNLEILRGAGTSLTSPEAMGGVINIQTINPTENSAHAQFNLGEFGLQDYQAVGTKIFNQGKTRMAIAGQFNKQGYFDIDGNGVSESPDSESIGGMVKVIQDLGSQTELTFRFSGQELTLLGGTTQNYKAKHYATTLADHTDFTDGDVRGNFLGTQEKISDFVNIKRHEYALSINKELQQGQSLKFSTGLAKQSQDAIYLHGFDYNSHDLLNFNDLRYSKLKGKHLWTIGADFKHHQLKSESEKLYGIEGLQRDNFKHQTLGVYLQDEWFLSDKSELSLALRLDQITVDWTEYSLKEKEIDEYILAPRINFVSRHNSSLTSRFNTGLGYRAPLTLYESQHGSNHDGFEIEIDKVEKSYGLGYALDYQQQRYSLGFNIDHSLIKNLSYAEDEHPMIFKNLDVSAEVTAVGLNSTYQILSSWALSASYDKFILSDNFASTLPTAAIEDRIVLQSDNHLMDHLELLTTLTFVGSRSLGRYNYAEHYNTSDGTNASNQKRQKAPSYYTVDITLNYTLHECLELTAGVFNLFDYTQTKKGDSPLTWVEHEPGDIHLDNFHIWGPNNGRQLFAGLSWSM